MIVAMKKVFLVVQGKDAEFLLKGVRKLGVLHVENVIPPKGDKLAVLHNDLFLLNQAIALLESEGKNSVSRAQGKRMPDWRPLAQHIIDLNKRFQQLKEYSVTLSSGIDKYVEWGDFDPQEAARLSLKGICLRLYKLSDEQIKSLPKDIYLKKINRQGHIYNCAIIADKNFNLPFKETEMPKVSLSMMQRRLVEDKKTAGLIKEELLREFVYLDYLKDTRAQIMKEVEFYEALSGMARQQEGLIYIKGYIPFDSENSIKEAAKAQGWGLLITEPLESDNVPTLVRNPKWLDIINPVFKIIEVIPGYRELDISLWFLIFFSIFFGILIGDAGYGAVYFLLTLIIHKKLGKGISDKSAFVLLYILSSCAIIWGILTASFFGQEWLPAWVKPVLPALRSDKNMQNFCFFLGALHLSIAHIWRALLKFPALSFLADIGWICILWFTFFIAKLLILGDTLPVFYPYLIITGSSLVVFFTRPQKNILKGFASGLGALALNIMNNFTDVVSYIRLFAVGLATLAVADAFNKMAMDIGFANFTAGLLTSLILLVGHTLNIILGPLAILVHGVRLNVLEFCSHLDIKWSGFSYKPLTEK